MIKQIKIMLTYSTRWIDDDDKQLEQQSNGNSTYNTPPNGLVVVVGGYNCLENCQPYLFWIDINTEKHLTPRARGVKNKDSMLSKLHEHL